MWSDKMKIKTSSFAAVTAVLLTFCLVFMAPVGADDVTADSSWYNDDDNEFTISTEEQLAGFVELVSEGTSFEGKTIILGNSITIKATASNGYGKTGVIVDDGVTLNGNGNTLTVTGAYGTWDSAVNAINGTIKDLTINGAFRGIFMGGAKGDVSIENVVLDNVCYTFNSDGGSKDYGVYISGSTLNGWTSFSNVHKEVIFADCEFGKGTGGYQYAFCRPYNACVFDDCTFADGFKIDTNAAGENKITFNNCKYGDTLITNSNAKTLELFEDREGEFSNVMIYPEYQYLITFDANGGEGVMDSQPFVSDESKTLTPNAFTRDDYTFNEWNTEADGSGTAYSDEAIVKNLATEEGTTITLYANWTKNIYDLIATPEKVGFDSVKVGYTQPGEKTVTITNGGNVPVTLVIPASNNYELSLDKTELSVSGVATLTIQPEAGLAVGNYAENIVVETKQGSKVTIPVSFLVYQPSSGGSTKPVEEPEEPVEPETPVDPETPTEEPIAGETTVETEVTDGGEVELENPTTGGSAAAEEDEAKITGVVLPTGTDSEVTFVPVSEQAAPEGKETQTKKVFEINVPTYEKGKAATIKFTMTVAELAADGKEAADVALWHFDEETGEWTKLVTSYTIVDGVVYFEAITNDFSPFAIIYEDEPADKPVDEPETPASPAPVLGLIAALGAAVVLRRK